MGIYKVLRKQSELDRVVRCLEGLPPGHPLFIDLETTGLDPRHDRIRLIGLGINEATFLVDAFSVCPDAFISALDRFTLVGQNLLFDLSFLWHKGLRPSNVADIMLMSQLLMAGMRGANNQRIRHGLDEIAERELGVVLDKDYQKSNWSGALTKGQLDYAAQDIAVLKPIYQRLQNKIDTVNLTLAAQIENRCLPAVVWMTAMGIPFDVGRWRCLMEEAEDQVGRIENRLWKSVGDFCVNWASTKQVQEIFRSMGYETTTTNVAWLTACDHPLAKLLLQHRGYKKLATSYAKKWLNAIGDDGRLRPHWLQNFTDTGRFAAASPNIQQMPRDTRYRNCVRAAPGMKLVCADMVQIEVRIVAKLAHEPTLLAIFKRGEDVHAATARLIWNKAEITKEERQIAKSAVFGLLYGAGVTTFRKYIETNCKDAAGDPLKLSQEEAADIRTRFFRAYPKLSAWHKSHGDGEVNTRTLTQRWRCSVDKFTTKNNAPSQGTGGDMIKLALALMWETREQSGDYYPIATIHDEIIAEGPAETAEVGADWVKRCMETASEWMIYPVPTAVSVSAVSSWGESK